MAEDVKVPEGWRRVKLGEIIEIFDNQRIPLDSESRSTIKGYIPYCGATGIIDYINDYIFDGEYVLIAEDGGKFNRFEETAYIMMGKFWANNHVHIVRGKDGTLDDCFLMYSVNYQDISYYISGSTREKLNQQLLKSVVILLPPFPEQRKIAEILETVDNAIEKTGRIIEKYKRIKQGLMQDLLTRGIDENGQIRSEETHRFRDSPLGRIPEEWKVVELGEISFITMGQSPSSSLVNKNGKGMAFLQGNAEFTNKYPSPTNWIKNPLKIANKGSILISVRAPIGALNLADTQYCIGRGLASIEASSNFVDSYFLWYSMQFFIDKLAKLGQGSTFEAIGSNELKTLCIPLPPLPEQRRIASILSQIDKTIEKEKKYKEKLERIKRGLMEDLLTGKVRVNHLIEEVEA